MIAPSWERHLPAGVRADDVDLTAKRSLPAAWRRIWASAPSWPALFDLDRGWVSAEQLEQETRRLAGRLRRRWARARGPDAVQRRVLAGARDRPRGRAALGDRRRPRQHGLPRARARPRREATPVPGRRSSTIPTAPAGSRRPREPGIVDARARRRSARPRAGATRRGAARGRRADRLHVGDDRRSQGRRALTRQPARGH